MQFCELTKSGNKRTKQKLKDHKNHGNKEIENMNEINT